MIKIYSKPDCQPCQASKKWLDERDIDYTEINVKTREGAREFRKFHPLAGIRMYQDLFTNTFLSIGEPKH